MVSACSFYIDKLKNLLSDETLDFANKGIHIIEFGPKNLAFTTSLKIQLQQKMLLSGNIIFGKEHFPFEFICRVTNIVPEDKDIQRLEVELTQYDNVLWQRFVTHVQQRQEHATFVFQSIKGEDGDV